MAHTDPASSGDITVTCPDGESPYQRDYGVPASPRIGYRVQRKDGQERVYADTEGRDMRVSQGEIVTVDSIGSCQGAAQKLGIRLRNAAGQVTRLLYPVSSWAYEDGCEVLEPGTRHSGQCSECGEPAHPDFHARVDCPCCTASFLVPAPDTRRRWQHPVLVSAGPGGVTADELKKVIEARKGVPCSAQILLRVGAPPSGCSRELKGKDVVQPRQRVVLHVTRTPPESLEHYLTRRDTQGKCLADPMKDCSPWEDPSKQYELDCSSGSMDDCILGEGSFGVVLRCRGPGGAKYAVKQVSKEQFARSFAEMRRGLVEICTSRFLSRHAHLVHFDSVQHDASHIYYIMPLLAGSALNDVLGSEVGHKVGTPPVMKRIMSQLLSAINHLHQHQIAHRDVKPDNIICDPKSNFDITLIDLGLARYYGTPSVVTGGIAGIPRPDDLGRGSGSAQPVHFALADCTPGQFTAVYTDHTALTHLINQGRAEQVKVFLPKMDIHSAGATLFACVTKRVAYYRQKESALPAQVMLKRMADRSAGGIEKERGFEDFKRHMGEDGAVFLKALMDPRPEARLTADQALRHSWLRGVVADAINPTPRTPPTAPKPGADAAGPKQERAAKAEKPKKLRTTKVAVQPKPRPWRRPADDEEVGAAELDARLQGEMLAMMPRARAGAPPQQGGES
eukprot:TRINITY_DN70421_c0_g1_i1.p1 TRINITY_DN70421_c0_g1~~TRINITY_DN70421_c0_g1_i1.p1  ORF type:complete len:677 (+),score=144.26 TRINITY_DN70421_c0_g1_i1:84-2114(+)